MTAFYDRSNGNFKKQIVADNIFTFFEKRNLVCDKTISYFFANKEHEDRVVERFCLNFKPKISRISIKLYIFAHINHASLKVKPITVFYNLVLVRLQSGRTDREGKRNLFIKIFIVLSFRCLKSLPAR